MLKRLGERSTWVGLSILAIDLCLFIFPELDHEIRSIGVPLLAGFEVLRSEK